jgi:hypothetical protein
MGGGKMTIEFDVAKQQPGIKLVFSKVTDEYRGRDFTGTVLYDIVKTYCRRYSTRGIQSCCYFAAKGGGIAKLDEDLFYFANGETHNRECESLGARMKSQSFPQIPMD